MTVASPQSKMISDDTTSIGMFYLHSLERIAQYSGFSSAIPLSSKIKRKFKFGHVWGVRLVTFGSLCWRRLPSQSPPLTKLQGCRPARLDRLLKICKNGTCRTFVHQFLHFLESLLSRRLPLNSEKPSRFCAEERPLWNAN
jgi:hypothetical protein